MEQGSNVAAALPQGTAKAGIASSLGRWVLGLTLIAPLTVLVFVFARDLQQPWKPSGTPGVEVAPTRHELKELAALLRTADGKGDAAFANQLHRRMADVLQAMNEREFNKGSPMNDCRLAAINLAAGIVRVGDGYSWTDQSRFEAALEGCAQR